MKTPHPIPAQTFASAAAGTTTLPAIPPAAVSENLTLFGAAAKAIFIKANGLAAYYKSTGIAVGAE